MIVVSNLNHDAIPRLGLVLRHLVSRHAPPLGVTARDLVEFTNLMKPFKSRKLLRHLDAGKSLAKSPDHNSDWATTTSQSGRT